MLIRLRIRTVKNVGAELRGEGEERRGTFPHRYPNLVGRAVGLLQLRASSERRPLS